jgi:type IV pilus assembly protein PilB
VLEGAEKKIIDDVVATIRLKDEITNTTKAWKTVGCDKCNHTGYRGRLGIYEAVLMDENIEKVVKENPSEREIMKAAEPQNIPTMRQDGIMKILNGTTSFDELRRVIDLERDY